MIEWKRGVIMEERYVNAFYEVYQIINLLDEKLYCKIPQKIIERFQKIAKKSNSNKVILPNVSLDKQALSYESKVLLKLIEVYL